MLCQNVHDIHKYSTHLSTRQIFHASNMIRNKVLAQKKMLALCCMKTPQPYSRGQTYLAKEKVLPISPMCHSVPATYPLRVRREHLHDMISQCHFGGPAVHGDQCFQSL